MMFAEVVQGQFKTMRVAEQINEKLRVALGMQYRHGPARLAIARSLAIPGQPPVDIAARQEPGKIIRGDPLFGSGAEVGAWAAFFIEHAGRSLTRHDLQGLVAAHWHRGAELLWREWEECGQDYGQFITLLCERGGLHGDGIKPRSGH